MWSDGFYQSLVYTVALKLAEYEVCCLRRNPDAPIILLPWLYSLVLYLHSIHVIYFLYIIHRLSNIISKSTKVNEHRSDSLALSKSLIII